MASNRAAAHALQSSKGQVSKIAQFKKYTVQPQGLWARINQVLAVDPKRSTGIPMNPQFRNPPPGALDPRTYDDPVTVPAADIAENPYWKRDVRRRYPNPSVVKQADVVALLSAGSAENPKMELVGEKGQQALVEVKQEGEKGLAAFLEKNGKEVGKSVLGENGLPPLPGGAWPKSYQLIPEEEQTYEGKYPCRTFV